MNRLVSLQITRLLIGLAAFAFLSGRQMTAQETSETPAPATVSQGDSESGVEESEQGAPEANSQEIETSNQAEEAFQRAMGHEENNELDKAIEDCTEALQSDPANIEYLNGRAHLYDEMRDQDQAMADIATVLELDRTNIRARTLRGKILERSGEADKALIEFDTAVQQNPTSLEALKERQYYFERQGRSDKAREDAERIVQLEPDSAKGNTARALSSVTDDQRINFASAAIQQDPDNWSAYKLRGLSRAASGDFAEATSDFEKAIELSPDNALIFSSRGAMYYMQGDYERSLADAQKAAELEPRNCSIMAILADRLATCPDSHLRDAGRASEYAAAALRLDPNEPLVWRACASAAAANGDFEHAKKWQQRVVNSNLLSHQKGDGEERLAAYNSGNPYVPNLPTVDEVLADKKMRRADEAINNGNFDRAVVLLSEVIAANPKSERAYAIRGLAYYNQQKYEQATADLNLAIELDPKDADSYDTRAHLFQKTSQYRRAVDDYKIVEKLDPNDATGVRNNLAWLLATCPDAPFRDGAKAAESINRSLELHPDNRSAWDTRAAVFAENGQFDHAISWESRYLEGKDLDATQRDAALERLALYKASKPYRQKVDKPIVSENVTPSVTPTPTGK